MDQDNISEKLKHLLADKEGKYKILEEQIDIDLQVDFFELIDKLSKKNEVEKDVNTELKELFEQNTTIQEQKIILAKLSNSETTEAYRAIEQFINSGNHKLKDWGILALQHCRLNLESHLLDEQKIFISTGLGGEDDKLRYFIVCKLKSNIAITNTIKKLIKTEFEFTFKESTAVIEKIQYYNTYFSILGLIPINMPVNEIIIRAINELNNYGGFIYDNYLVTNVKILNKLEIENYFKNKAV
jgi:hypothetical protein